MQIWVVTNMYQEYSYFSTREKAQNRIDTREGREANEHWWIEEIEVE